MKAELRPKCGSRLPHPCSPGGDQTPAPLVVSVPPVLREELGKEQVPSELTDLLHGQAAACAAAQGKGREGGVTGGGGGQPPSVLVLICLGLLRLRSVDCRFPRHRHRLEFRSFQHLLRNWGIHACSICILSKLERGGRKRMWVYEPWVG